MKRQPTEWEKIFASDVTDRGFMFKIYKQLMQLNIKTHTHTHKQPNQKMGKRPKQTFLQRRYTDGQEAHEKMSGEGIQKREPFYTVSGNILINWCRQQGEQHRGSSEN